MDVRVFESRDKSFHPKAYIFHGAFPNFGKGVAYVGSSNLSRSALTDAVEWNYRIVPAGNDSGQNSGFKTVVREFERLFTHPQTTPLTPDWIARYRARRPTERQAPVGVPACPPKPWRRRKPHAIQQEALEQTRSEGNAAGLVVLATGLGKTWLAAFDTDRFRAKARPLRRPPRGDSAPGPRYVPPDPTRGHPGPLHRHRERPDGRRPLRLDPNARKKSPPQKLRLERLRLHRRRRVPPRRRPHVPPTHRPLRARISGASAIKCWWPGNNPSAC